MKTVTIDNTTVAKKIIELILEACYRVKYYPEPYNEELARKEYLGYKPITNIAYTIDDIHVDFNIMKTVVDECVGAIISKYVLRERLFQDSCSKCGYKRTELLNEDSYSWICPECGGYPIVTEVK